MLYMVTLTINIPQMLAYIPYMDPMGIYVHGFFTTTKPTGMHIPQSGHVRQPPV